jgi:hypothetical protein
VVLFSEGVQRALAQASGVEGAPMRSMLAQLAGLGAEEVADRLDAAIGSGLTDDAAFVVVRRL